MAESCMYEKFYGFRERPFNVTPGARFFFPSEKHQEALDSLYYAVTQRLGFVVVTGEIGAGKTTVCRTLIGKLPGGTKVATVSNGVFNVRSLLGMVLDEFELPAGDREPAWKLLARLNRFLIQALSRDENVVLMIDEAQNLTPALLESVRLLSNLETDQVKLLQIILAGQPEFRKKLDMPRLAQLKQRIAVSFHIEPLSAEETAAYIEHRQRKAGAPGSAFSPEAVEAIFAYSRGVPRLVNLACERGLLAGYAESARPVEGPLMRQVVSELMEQGGWNAAAAPACLPDRQALVEAGQP